jgi:hypothetical protein
MRHTGVLLALAAAACVTQPRPRPDDMSAAAHRREAERERQIAHDHLDEYVPESIMTMASGREDVSHPVVIYNPTSWHLAEADRHSEHARQHEQAARDLERFEEGECREFPPETRAACPIVGGVAVARVTARGVILELAPGVPFEALAAHMRCHLAFSRARGYDANVTCPVYMKGLTIRADARARTIALEGPDAAAGREVQRRTREIIHGVRPEAVERDRAQGEKP